MSNYYIQPLDPQELAARFALTDALEPLPEGDPVWRESHLEKIQAVLHRLPEREADLIRLYYFLSKRQTDIAEIFGVTQAAISYRLARALKRLRFLVEIPEVTKDQVFEDLKHYFVPLDAHIFAEMYDSTCQSEVALRLGISQGRVRHRFIANLAKLGLLMAAQVGEWTSTLPIKKLPEEIREVVTSVDRCLTAFEDSVAAQEEPEDQEKALAEVVVAMRDVPPDHLNPDLMLLAEYYKMFLTIRYNFNLLREIRLPKWTARAKRALV